MMPVGSGDDDACRQQLSWQTAFGQSQLASPSADACTCVCVLLQPSWVKQTKMSMEAAVAKASRPT